MVIVTQAFMVIVTQAFIVIVTQAYGYCFTSIYGYCYTSIYGYCYTSIMVIVKDTISHTNIGWLGLIYWPLRVAAHISIGQICCTSRKLLDVA